VLSDEKKRALYDRYGEAGVKSAVGGPGGAYTVLHLYSCLLKINSILPLFLKYCRRLVQD
jgi:DnaJ-class molecular chaperone